MGKIAFLFSGQGAQYSGMGKDMYDNIAVVKNLYDAAESKRPGTCMQCFDSDEETLKLTENTQPCMFLTDLAFARALEEHGVHADETAGFSLGEIAALTYAGAFTEEDGFDLVCKRAELMGECNRKYPGSMAAVLRTEPDKLAGLCSEYGVYAVNYNCPGQTSVSGNADKMEEFMAKLKEIGIRYVKLPVSGSFHTPYMSDAAKGLATAVESINVKASDIPVYSNYTAMYYPDNASDIRRLISMQVSHSVKWEDIIRNMYKNGCDTFIECGPGQTLSGFVKKTLKDVNIYNVNSMESLMDTCSKLNI